VLFELSAQNNFGAQVPLPLQRSILKIQVLFYVCIISCSIVKYLGTFCNSILYFQMRRARSKVISTGTIKKRSSSVPSANRKKKELPPWDVS
jgi:hypothetical protein